MTRAILLAGLLVVSASVPGGDASARDASPVDPLPDGVGAGVSGPDSLALLSEAQSASDPPGDVRRILSGGPVDVLSREPAVRSVGSGWRGHRASIAHGALPATFTSLSVAGRRTTDCITDGLDLISTYAAAPGVLVTPSGPDLSLWPVYAGALPVVTAQRSGSPPVVEMRPGRRPPARPYARLTMGGGDLAWQASGVEFGRRYRGDRLGLGGFVEKREGRAPVAGGSYDLDVAGGRLLLPIAGGWLFEAAGRRAEMGRGLPAAYSSPDSLDTHYTSNDLSLAATDGRSRVGLFHATARLDARTPAGDGGTMASSRDGAAARIEWDEGPLDAVDLAVVSRRMRGSLVSGGAAELEADGTATRAFDLDRGWQLSVSGGWRQSAGSGFPVGRVAASSTRSPSWAISLSADGRHPTASERQLVPFEIPGGVGAAIAVAGNSGVDPERAVVLAGDWRKSGPSGGLGARAEVARVLAPLALRIGPSGEASPANLADDTTAALSLWADLGDTSRAGARLAVDLFSFDEDGAVLSRAPVPVASVTASAWVTRSFFRHDYLETRWEISVVHAAGRARGPWDGLLDDDATSVSAAVSAWAGSARLYALVEDILDERPLYLPGMPGAGRSLTAGFSWSFHD